MSSAVLKGNASGTGIITLETPNTNTDMTIALPARAGNLMMDGPAFSAYQNSVQTGISNFTPTKITFDTEVFDTNNNFSSSRFTPTVAGYYQINSAIEIPYNNTAAYVATQIYKNGARIGQGSTASGNGGTYPASSASSMMYMNGTTDYVEIYIYGAPNSGSTFNIVAGQGSTYFNGSLVRGA